MWYDQPLQRRAPRSGAEVFGKQYGGGEFLPFYVPRMVMPQVDLEFYPQLIDFAREHGVGVTEVLMDPHAIRPHQRIEVDKMRKMDETTLKKPILGSVEPYVLDGHHRLYNHQKMNEPVKTWRFNLEFREAIKFLFTFPATYSYGDGNDHPFTS